MDRRETLARAVLATRPLMTRYLAGFDDHNRAAQAPSLPNHPAWILGHCALTMHRLGEHLDRKPLPESDFFTSEAPSSSNQASDDTPTRYDTEMICFDSEPAPDATPYPPLARGVEIFSHACERLADAIRSVPDERMDEEMVWGGTPFPISALVVRVCFHNGTHAGQLTDLRRALRFDRVIT